MPSTGNLFQLGSENQETISQDDVLKEKGATCQWLCGKLLPKTHKQANKSKARFSALL